VHLLGIFRSGDAELFDLKEKNHNIKKLGAGKGDK
jgi:hypothetical protein